MSAINTGKSNRILIVDDTKTDRDVFQHVLTQAGFDVDTIGDGQQALLRLAEKEYDLVLCDYLMPTMDGQQFLTEVRKDARLAHTIVIIITSDESQETKVKLLRAGANDFIQKGVSYDEITNRLRVHLDAQNSHTNKKVLQLAGEIAYSINQPVSAIVMAIEVLNNKMAEELTTQQKVDYGEVLKTLTEQGDILMKLAKELKSLKMDQRNHYKFEREKKY